MKDGRVFYRYCTGFKGLAGEGDDRNEESTHTHAGLAPYPGTGIDRGQHGDSEGVREKNGGLKMEREEREKEKGKESERSTSH